MILFPYLVGGEEGFYQPGPADQCLTRDAARNVALAESAANEDASMTALAPEDALAERMLSRLLELGVPAPAAARACDALRRDVEAMHEGGGLEEQVSCVRVTMRRADGEWERMTSEATDWADAPLWADRDGRQ